MTTGFIEKAIARAEGNEAFVGHALLYWRDRERLDRPEAAKLLGTSISGYTKAALCLIPPQHSAAFAASVDRIARHAGCDPYRLLSVLRDYGIERAFAEKYGCSVGILLAARDNKETDKES